MPPLHRVRVSGGLRGVLGHFHGLLLAFLVALLITVIDAVALWKTKSIMGFFVNDAVGLLMIFAVYKLCQNLGGL